MWAAPGPADVGGGTGTSVAAEDSWDYCVGLVTPQSPNAAAAAAAGAAFGGKPAAAGKMEVLGCSEQAEGPEVVVEDLLQPPHRYHPLAGQTWHYAAASGGGAGAGASAEVQLWPAAGAPSLCNLAPAVLVDHLAAEDHGVVLLKGPGPLEVVAFLVVPGNSGPVVPGTAHDSPSAAAVVL